MTELVVTTFTGANGLVLLNQRAQRSLAKYITDFARRRNPKLEDYIDDNLIKQIIPKEPSKTIQAELDKIMWFDFSTTKTPYIYRLDVSYEKRGIANINSLLRVICLRHGVDIVPRGKRDSEGDYCYSILIDIAKGGELTDGVARLARLAYYLNQI